MKRLIAFSAALAMIYSIPAFAVYSETSEDTVISAEDTSAEEGGDLYIVNGSMTPLKNTGAAYDKGKGESNSE